MLFYNGEVILRQTRSGREVAHFAHAAGITDLAFGADGSVLASTTNDGSTRLIDCRTGLEVARLAHGSMPKRVRFSPDAKYLATETGEGVQVWLWRARDMVEEACQRVTRDLHADEWRLYLGEDSPTACRAQAR
jgi:WD40 repeat protein